MVAQTVPLPFSVSAGFLSVSNMINLFLSFISFHVVETLNSPIVLATSSRRKHPTSPKVHYSEGLGLGLG